jgi:hypothetical protein
MNINVIMTISTPKREHDFQHGYFDYQEDVFWVGRALT